jgi:hypothetical protein
MAAPRYPGTRTGSGRRGLSVVECIFAVSVIVGLMFVTVRVMNIGEPPSGAETVVVKSDAPLVPDDPGTKTP